MVIHRGWSELPSELLEHIVEHLVFISDFIRFRSVCTSWRAAALPKTLRPQPPLLLFPYNALNPNRYFFSVATGQTHHLSLPQLVGKQILDSVHGWMLLLDVETKALSLLNPITLAQAHLPPIPNFEFSIWLAYLFHDIITDNFVVLVPDREQRMVFCRAGDESWSAMETNLKNGYELITYHKGKFVGNILDSVYMNDASLAHSDRSVLAFSLYDLPEYWGDSDIYFVTVDDELFLICDPALDSPDTDELAALYKLDYDGRRIKWSKVPFGDYAMFCSLNHRVMLHVKDFPQYKGGCFYSSLRIDRNCEEDVHRPVVGILDWKDGTYGCMACGWEKPDDFNKESLWITLGF